MTAGDGDSDRAAVELLRRSALYELQTGGGLALSDLAGPGQHPSVSAHIRGIRALSSALTELRTQAADRARAALSEYVAPKTVLDLGAGRAPWSLCFARSDPEVRVTAIDLPQQIPVLESAVSAEGRAHQYRLVPADFFALDDEQCGPFDLVIVANVCHLFSAALTRQVLGAAADRLGAGGVLAVIDQVLVDTPDWTRWSALYAVGLPHLNPGGHLFSPAEYRAWIADMGLEALPTLLLCPAPSLTLVAARRP